MRVVLKTALFLAAGAFACSGCSTHLEKTAPARSAWSMGETGAAQAALEPLVWKYADTDDEVIWRLEYGAVARANGDVKESAKSFELAEEKMASFDKNADTVITEETAAILTNQSALPYRGYNYDKIMMSAYQALNYMELGNFDLAEVNLKRMENYQQDAKNANLKNIERTQKAISAAGKENINASYDASKTISDAGVSNALKAIYGDDFSMNARVVAASDYANPFAYWLAGMYFSSRPADSSDKNRAADFFRLASQSVSGSNKGIAEDIKLANSLADGDISSIPPRTYVIFEKGLAPLRMQSKINLPLYIINGNIPHVSMNFPYLKKSIQFSDGVCISAGGKEIRMEKLTDMDKIIEREFNDGLPEVITKTVLSAAVKAGIQVAARQAAGDGWAGLAVNIAGSIYQSVVNDADLRTWTSLPKEILTASFETPKDGVVKVGTADIKVNPNSTNVILIRKTSPSAKITARSFELTTPKKAIQ